jgi:hypothetical protein
MRLPAAQYHRVSPEGTPKLETTVLDVVTVGPNSDTSTFSGATEAEYDSLRPRTSKKARFHLRHSLLGNAMKRSDKNIGFYRRVISANKRSAGTSYKAVGAVDLLSQCLLTIDGISRFYS